MIEWKSQEYRIKDFSRKILMSDLNFFDRDKEYKFTHLGKLGEGNYGIVDRFQVDILSKNNTKSFIMAAKSFKNPEPNTIREYILKLFYIKKYMKKVGTLRILDINHNEQKSVKIKLSFLGMPTFIRKNLDLSQLVFFTDLTNRGFKKNFPINIGEKLNFDLLSYSLDKRIRIYNRVIEDIYLLFKNGFFIRVLDLWMIIEDFDNEIRPYLLDVDNIYPINNKLNLEVLRDKFLIILKRFFEDLSGGKEGYSDDYDYLMELFDNKFGLK